MASVIQGNFRVRKNFAKITKIIDIPNLIRETGDKVEITERRDQQITFLIERLAGLGDTAPQ